MGTFEEDNRIGAFSRLNVEHVYQMFTDGDISAEQALKVIAVDAGVIERSDRQKALGQMVYQVARDEIPMAALIAAIDDRGGAPVLPEIRLSVTRSAGDDRAVLVFVDTTFEPDGSDGGPGLRVLVNDGDAFIGKEYDDRSEGEHPAKARRFEARLDQIPYLDEEVS
jgi:hypothetical protein